MQVALINKINKKLKITDIFEASNKDLSLLENYAIIDDSTKYIYNNLLLRNKLVYITEEALLKKLITKDDFIIEPVVKEEVPISTAEEPNGVNIDPFGHLTTDYQKQKLYKQLDNILASNINTVGFLRYIEYISLFNYFAAMGIFITKENKEDKYIEILELDDEAAVDKLEKYLNIQDTLEEFIKTNDKIAQVKEDIEYADKEELEKISEDIQTGKTFEIEL